MKKIISLTTAVIFYCGITHAQTWVPTVAGDIVTDQTNNVGIGTTTPTDKLTVQDGNISMPNRKEKAVRYLTARTPEGMLCIGTDPDLTATNPIPQGPQIAMAGIKNGWRQGSIWYSSCTQNTDPEWGNAQMFINYNEKAQNWTNLMSMRDEDGYPKLAIGTVPSQPYGYSLFVQNGILTEKVKVALASSNNWSDYVFAQDYKLKSLPEVEKYIKENKHLPGVPAAQELVNQGGIDMNEMFAKQMEKIEELTLYMIELKKEIEVLKQKISQ